MRANPAYSRARKRPWGWVVGLCAATMLIGSGSLSFGASQSESVVITAEVLSATNISIDPTDPPTAGSCLTGTADVTDFGLLMPESLNVTSQDCVVVFGSSNDTSRLLVYQEDSNDRAMFAYSTGDGDAAWGDVGAAFYSAAPGSDNLYGAVMDASGLLVTAGAGSTDTIPIAIIARWLDDGTIDPSFGPDGTVEFTPGGVVDRFNAVDRNSSGLTCAAGVSNDGGDSDLLVACVDSGGDVIPGFGSGGAAVIDLGAEDEATDIVVLDDGRVAVSAIEDPGAARLGTVVMLQTDGSPEPSFGAGGIRQFVTPDDLDLHAIVADADQNLVVAGIYDTGPDDDFFVGRLLADGSDDPSFNGGSPRNWHFSGSEGIDDIDIDYLGRIVYSGYTNSDQQWAIGRLLDNGSSDPAFGGGSGIRTGNFGGTPAWADNGEAVKVLHDNTIMFVGNDAGGVPRLKRLMSDGTDDVGFGPSGNGNLSASYNTGDEYFYDLVLAPDGDVIAVGDDDSGGNDRWYALRLDGTPVPDWQSGVDDWTPAASSMFGACLRSVGGGGVAGLWTVDDTPVVNDGDCDSINTDPWNAVAATSAGGSAPVAESTSPGTTDARAYLRFGLRVGSGHAAGRLVAPLVVEAVAPNA